MGILAWEERGAPRSASTDEQQGQTIPRSFDVWMTDPLESGFEVIAGLAGLGVVFKGGPHPNYPLARCTRVQADCNDEDPTLWRVTASYAEPPPQPGQDEQQQDQQPKDLDEIAPVYSCRSQTTEEYDLQDCGYDEGKLSPEAQAQIDNNFPNLPPPSGPVQIVNAAGDWFDNPPPKLRSIGVLTVKRWYLVVDAKTLEDTYKNRVNRDMVTITSPVLNATFGPDSLRVADLSFEPRTVRGWKGVEATIVVEYKPLPSDHLRPGPGDRGFPMTGGWLPTAILNIGWRGRKAKNDPKGVAADGFGMRGGPPVLLDKDGVIIEDPDAPPTYRFFYMYERAALSPLLT